MKRSFFVLAAVVAAEVALAEAKVARSLSLTVSLDPANKGAVTRLVGADGFDYVARPTHLCEFSLTRKEDFNKVLRLTSRDAAKVEIAEEPDGLRATFSGFPEAIDTAVVTVRGDDRLRWRFDVKTKDGWVLEKGTCPRVIL